MGEPKLVKGMLGWAAIGDGLIVYAKTKAEAQRRYRTAQEAEAPNQCVNGRPELVVEVDLIPSDKPC